MGRWTCRQLAAAPAENEALRQQLAALLQLRATPDNTGRGDAEPDEAPPQARVGRMANEIRDNTGRRRFELYVDGELAGVLAYRRTPDATRLIHTGIDDAFAGRGLGSVFAHGVLEFLRGAGESIVPECPFIAKYIAENPEYADLVV